MEYTSEIWEKVTETLKDEIGETCLKTWITSIQGVHLSSDACTLTAPSEFHKCILEMRYFHRIKNTIESVTGSDMDLSIVTAPNDKSLMDNKSMPEPEITFTNKLNKAYSFDNFVSGQCNRKAVNAARKFLNTTVQSTNPLIILGGTGTGKTHLLQAIGNAYKENERSSGVLYIGIYDFINELLKQLKRDNRITIERSLEHLKLLLIDDLHLIEGKERTQSELMSLLYSLKSKGVKIVLGTSKTIEKLMIERNLFLLDSDSTVKLTIPDFQTKIRILEQYAKANGAVLSRNEFELIASGRHKGIRELMGAFNKAVLCRQITAIL